MESDFLQSFFITVLFALYAVSQLREEYKIYNCLYFISPKLLLLPGKLGLTEVPIGGHKIIVYIQ